MFAALSALPGSPPSEPSESSPGSSIGDVVTTIWDNLGNNGYQTGISVFVTTLVVVALLNQRVHLLIIIPTAIGAFWGSWLGYNTLTGEDNPLFPGDVSATKLWDVALAGDRGFLIVVSVACVAAIFVWRKSTVLAGRLMLMLGAVLGASFLYNMFEAVRAA